MSEANQRTEQERQKFVEAESEWKAKWEQECAALRQQHEQLLASQLTQVEAAWCEKERSYKAEAADMLASARTEFDILRSDAQVEKERLERQLDVAKKEAEETQNTLVAERVLIKYLI